MDKIAKKKNDWKWKENKETGGSYTRTWNYGRLGTFWLQVKFKTVKSYPHLRCCNFCFKVYEFFILCSGQLWLFLQLVVSTIIMKMVSVEMFGKMWDQSVLGTLVSSTFDKKRMILDISFGVITRFSGTVLFVLIKTVKLQLFLTI